MAEARRRTAPLPSKTLLFSSSACSINRLCVLGNPRFGQGAVLRTGQREQAGVLAQARAAYAERRGERGCRSHQGSVMVRLATRGAIFTTSL